MFTGGTPRRVPQQTLSSAQAAGSLPFATPKAKTVATATGSATAVSTSPISEFLSRHETHAVLVGGASLPETVVADLAKEVAHSPENLTSSVIVHGARGLVVVPRTTELLIWHAKKTTGQAQVLPLPPQSASHSSLPQLAWVPSLLGWDAAAHKDSIGLLCVTGSGHIRFWESLALGSGHFVGVDLGLSDGENPSLLRDCSGAASIFLLATNKGLYKIMLTNNTGSTVISCLALQKSTGMLSRLLTFQQQSGVQDRSDVLEMLPVRSVDRQVNILSPTVLERWALSSTSDKFLYQVSIKDLVQKSIERDLPDPAAFAETVIEDAVPADQERLILLVRFTLLPSPIAYYMVVLLQLDGEGILILDKKQLSYQQELPNVSPHLQSFQKPRLGYVEHGAILFAFFRNAIVLTSSLPESDFEQVIQLQNQDNVLFGFGTYYQKAGAHREEGDKCVALLFTSNPKISLLQVEAQPALIHAAKPERQLQARVTESIRLNLEQAIFFGATGSGSSGFINPLSFDLCSQASGDLEEVCLQVSDSILRSESKHIHPALDLRIQMSERIGRLNQIITYVNENQAMNLISEAGRWKLCQNVEKMVAGLSLWQYQNSLLSDSQQMDQEPYLHTLSAGITSFMKRFGVADNAVRLFFKHHLDSLSELMGSLLAPIPRSLSARYSQSLALEIHEVSKIVVMIYRQSIQYREENASRYGLGPDCLCDPWLASPKMLKLMQAHVEVVEGILAQFPEVSQGQMQTSMSLDGPSYLRESPAHLLSALREDLCDLVDCSLGAYQQRVLFLQSLSTQEAALEAQAVRQTSLELQPRFIYPLVKHMRKSDAFKIAEKYQNFQVLVNLTLDDPNQDLRIEDFTKRYLDSFAHVLFATYLDRGMYANLLEQHVDNQDSLDSFLARANVPWLSWIQDINRGRYDASYTNLMAVVDSEPLLEKKKLALDLAKLSILTSVSGVMEMINGEYLEQMGNMQEFVNLQIVLRNSCLKECRAKDVFRQDAIPVMDVVGELMNLHFKELNQTKSVCKMIVHSCLKKLVQGQMLSPKELIDLLSLWDKSDEADEILTAVGVLGLAHPPIQEPELVRNRLWRRVLLKTDWKKIHLMLKRVSDEELKHYLRDTSMYRCLESALKQSMDNNVLQKLIVSPTLLKLTDTLSSLGREYPSLAGDQLLQLMEEVQEAQEKIQHALADFQLELFFTESVNEIQANAS